MKQILILSCSTGQGHNSCAQAIKAYAEAEGGRCDIVDALSFVSPGFAKAMSKGHSFIYRNIPWLFSWGYRSSERHPNVLDKGSTAYRILTSGTEQMAEWLKSRQYDTILCTHVFSAMMLTRLLSLHPMPVKTAFVATDYTCSPGTAVSDLQHYFIPDLSLCEEFVRRGIPKDRIAASGIPVRRDFWHITEKTDAKRLLGVNSAHKHLLIMCGSMGCGPIPGMLRGIRRNLPPNTEVTVICGTNHRLEKRLKRQCRHTPEIHIVGYTNQMSLYMDSADLYLTKPGGISVTEAAAKRLPMAFINAVDGCESYNMSFFLDRHAAIKVGSPIKAAKECLRLLHSEDTLRRMTEALQEYRQSDGAKIILNTISTGESL